MELSREIVRTFQTSASPSRVIELLGDVPRSGAHMPDVERIDACADGHRWSMKRLGAGRVSLQAVYCSRFVADLEALTVTWGPRPDLGNSWAEGEWQVSVRGAGSEVRLRSVFGVNLPLPGLMKRPALAVFEREYGRLIKTYCEHLKRTLDGGDGRIHRW